MHFNCQYKGTTASQDKCRQRYVKPKYYKGIKVYYKVQLQHRYFKKKKNIHKLSNYITANDLFHESLVLKSCSMSPLKQPSRPFFKAGVYLRSRTGSLCNLRLWKVVKDGNSSKTNLELNLSSDANNVRWFPKLMIADFGSPISQTLVHADPNLLKQLLLSALFSKTREPTVPCPMPPRDGVSGGWEKIVSSDISTLGR